VAVLYRDRFIDHALQVDVTVGKTMTFGEFHADVEMAARHLLRLGCRCGDVIAIFSPNSFQWMMVAAAGLRIGAVFAAVNHLLKPGIQLAVCLHSLTGLRGRDYIIASTNVERQDTRLTASFPGQPRCKPGPERN